ncbi:2,3-bisphosphoglycerate-independent phosphoglycerate mutase [Candidatus Microgenomates bacterium]|nr:2,3-bisphosphoglycerate-independent phosphoglycerate mutase [Candidatus Microgenomates bacterium]
MVNSKLVVLAILDGWGIASDNPGNAISQATTPNMDKFVASFPHTQLIASGEAVGLPRGEAGNTETGHLNLGAGRVVYQDLERINMSIADGSFFKNQVLLDAITHAQKNNSKLHLMGLVGASGVHSNIEHLFALIQLSARLNFKNVYLHLFTDGRDSPPTSAKTYIEKILQVTQREGVGTIASIMGRYWAMDRDLRWERTQRAYDALVKGQGVLYKTPQEAIDKSYENGKTDEFIEPALMINETGKPITLISANDAVVFFNFRIDRPRQLTRAFVFQDFTKSTQVAAGFDPYAVKYKKTHLIQQENTVAAGEPFTRGAAIPNLYFVTMTEYSKPLVEEGAKVAFPPEIVQMPLGRVISDNALRQLRMCESEKERFVTFYFNGQQEIAFPGEDRLIIPSPKVPMYDQQPQMSAREVTNALLERLQSGEYSLVIVNFANADMVGHTGNIGAAVTACGVVDECLGKISNYVLAYGGTLMITADHGNAEEMINNQTGQIDTEHNPNPVPFIAISKDFLGKGIMLQSGVLADIAPTILKQMGLEIPTSMTGKDLLTALRV